jgi:hypothetical protein
MRTAEFVNSYFDAWNHGDPEAVAAHLSQNGKYCDIPEHVEWTHDELIGNLERFSSPTTSCQNAARDRGVRPGGEQECSWQLAPVAA